MRRIVAVPTAAAIALALVAGGCSSPPPPGVSPVVVPALWAVTKAGTSGIERASVTVDLHAAGGEQTPGFSIDLATEEAQGAGPQWTAASAAAAATAMLWSGVDPSTVSISFTVTGQIDGPSAGGILTVGTLAALRGETLDPDVTMTGMISPDGSIGIVGGVPLKIRAAAAAGLKTVLVPAVLTDKSDELVEEGRQLGVEVIGVRTVDAAYAHFTGRTLDAMPATMPSLTPAVETATKAITDSMIAQLDEVIAALPAGKRSAFAEDRHAADFARYSEDHALSYGIAASAYRRALQVKTRADVIAAMTTMSRTEIVTQIDDFATEVRADLATAILEAVDKRDLGIGQQMSLISALGWLFRAYANTLAVRESLSDDMSEDEVLAAARVIIDQRAAVNAYWPGARAIVDAMPNAPVFDADDGVRFLAGYSRFLRRAAQANTDYLDDVYHDRAVLGLERRAAQIMLDEAEVDPANPLQLPDEVADAAAALSAYVLTGAVIAAEQDALHLGGHQEDSAMWARDPVALTAAVETASGVASMFIANAAKRDVVLDLPIWSTKWTMAVTELTAGTDLFAPAATLALEELWYAAIGGGMLDAATQLQAAKPSATATR